MKLHQILGRSVFLLVLAVALQGSAVVYAQDQDDQPDQPDPPGRVARMNYTEGSVSFQPSGQGDWVQAVPNRPLTTGDNLWADQNSRAELHIGSTALRMSSETSITFLDLDDRVIQVRLSQGSLIVRAQNLDQNNTIEIDTPNLAYTLQQDGEYRVDVNGDGSETRVSVFRGRGQVTGGGYNYTVIAGQQARFTGTESLNYDIADIPQHDDFDNWAFDRDRHEQQSVSARYVSPETTGYQDLDAYGDWQYAEGYGQVWAPRTVSVGWAPYRSGHWVWIDPWGWTWVDDQPWGFAPYHYGRWAFYRERWFWVPGPVAVRPVYAPALVVFVGGGGYRFAEGPGVAWFPLGPREVYIPSRRFSPRYVQNVNVTNTVVNVTQVTNVYNVYRTNNTTNITKITYVNQRRPNAVTVVNRDTFVNARPVERNIVRVSQREIEAAPVTRTVDERPVRASVLGAGAAARVKPPAAVVNRQVVAERQPPSPRPTFDRQQGPANTRPADVSPRDQQNNPRPGQTPEVRPVPRPDRPGTDQQRDMGRPNDNPRPNDRSNDTARPNDNRRPDDTPSRNQPDNSGPDAPRPNQPPRPGQPGTPSRPPDASRPPDSRMPAQPARPSEPPRTAQPQRPGEPDNPRAGQPADNRGGQAAWSHPLARPVPPPREKDQRELQDEQNKERAWEQRHPQQQSQPDSRRAPEQKRPEPPKDQKPPKPPNQG